VPQRRYSLDDQSSFFYSSSNLKFLKGLFRFIFVISHFTAIYSLYFLDSLALFLVSFSFGITIGVLYLITFILNYKKSLLPKKRHRRPKKSFTEVYITLISILSFVIIGALAYFLYQRNSLVLNPYSRIKLTDLVGAWDYSQLPPVFSLTGKVANNNPYTIQNIKIQAKIFTGTEIQSALSTQQTDLSQLNNNSTTDFKISFPDLLPQEDLRYSVTFSL